VGKADGGGGETVKPGREMADKGLRMWELQGFTRIETSAKPDSVLGFSQVSLPPKPTNYYYLTTRAYGKTGGGHHAGA
jgi:hypothetical protein